MFLVTDMGMPPPSLPLLFPSTALESGQCLSIFTVIFSKFVMIDARKSTPESPQADLSLRLATFDLCGIAACVAIHTQYAVVSVRNRSTTSTTTGDC